MATGDLERVLDDLVSAIIIVLVDRFSKTKVFCVYLELKNHMKEKSYLFQQELHDLEK